MDKADCEDFRRRLKVIADELGSRRYSAGSSEANANITLAYRHLEDASMRLGKAIQAMDGGASVYDITQVPKSA